jgi:outer membrane receptor for ferric coprogen and ferric-rhodotorulic acid
MRRKLHVCKSRSALAAAALCLAIQAQAQDSAAAPAAAASAPDNAPSLPAVVVKGTSARDGRTERSGAYTARRSASATGLDLSPRETPQAVSVVTRTQMDDFRLSSVNDVLSASTGVVVEKVETDRTYYTARGFDITNFQVDGIGLPFLYGNVDGDLDTAVYDRVEVIRGANGLMSATGQPSATVNFVRKRPTAKLQASAALSLGSWNDKRVEADVSGPLNASKSLRGRFVAAAQDKDSHLDRYHLRKHVVHGVLEADIGERTVLTLGHTQQQNRPTGVLWGALPLYFSDGTPTSYDRSTSTSANWTYWNTDTGISFLEALHEFDNGWRASAALTHKKVTARSKLFYVYGTPDRTTGLGLAAYPSNYSLDNTQKIADLRASGPVSLAGRAHELIVGASVARSTLHDVSLHGAGIGTPLPDLATWDGSYPEPPFTVPGGGSDVVDRQRSVYAAARINPSDDLKLIVGANHTAIETEGTSYGASRARTESKTSPYIGVVYDIARDWSVYASRATIFKPQSEVDASFNRLAPATGSNVELGVKTEWLDKRLYGSVAVFKTRQNNLATYADFVNGMSIHEGVDTIAKGFELELAGALTDRLQLNAGYTQLSLKDRDGEDARTFTPRRLLRVAATYRVPAIDKLRLGASVDWRSSTWRDQGGGIVTRQPSYALLNLMARYDFSERLSAALNVYNATDERYLTSLYWSQGFYGAPRHGSVTVSWKY